MIEEFRGKTKRHNKWIRKEAHRHIDREYKCRIFPLFPFCFVFSEFQLYAAVPSHFFPFCRDGLIPLSAHICLLFQFTPGIARGPLVLIISYPTFALVPPLALKFRVYVRVCILTLMLILAKRCPTSEKKHPGWKPRQQRRSFHLLAITHFSSMLCSVILPRPPPPFCVTAESDSSLQ